MKDNSKLESVIPVSRRRVLKAGAATAAGAGLFSGIASATNPEQINFCGCSQVCVDRGGVGGWFKVITAWEEDGSWKFNTDMRNGDAEFSGQENFCYDVEGSDPEKKVIAVKPRDSEDHYVYCNPNQCAQKALDVWFEREYAEDFYCVNDGFELVDSDPAGGTVDIVQGQCGKAGRGPNPGSDGPQGSKN